MIRKQLVATALLSLVAIWGCSKVPKFDHYGVFIESTQGLQEIKPMAIDKWSGWTKYNDEAGPYKLTTIWLDAERGSDYTCDMWFYGKKYSQSKISVLSELELFKDKFRANADAG